MKVLAIGDNAADCYLNQNLFYPGGNAVNFIVNLKRSGIEKADYMGVFGDDLAACYIEEVLLKEGIGLARCRKMYAKTAHPQVSLTEDGDRIFTCSPPNTSRHLVRLNFNGDDIEYIKSFDLLYLSCFSNLDGELPMLKGLADIAFDFSIWYSDEYLEKICPHIKYAFFSAAGLSGKERKELIRKCKSFGVKVAGLTLAKEGALFSEGDNIYTQKAVELSEILDSMGAGDSFSGGFMAKYLMGTGMEKSLEYAAQRAAETCSFYGAFGYPKEIYSGMFGQ